MYPLQRMNLISTRRSSQRQLRCTTIWALICYDAAYIALLRNHWHRRASECRDLVDVAKRHSAILQVGHVERFNPAWTTIADRMNTPRFIEATREGTLTFRSMDGGAVLDLMIHDIDLVLSIVKSPIVSVQSETFNWDGRRGRYRSCMAELRQRSCCSFVGITCEL